MKNKGFKKLLAFVLSMAMVLTPIMAIPTSAASSRTSYELSVKLFNKLLDDEEVINSFYLDINNTYINPDDPKDLVKVAAFGKELTKGITDNYQKAKTIFEWFNNNFTYNYKFADEKEEMYNKYIAEGLTSTEAALKSNTLLDTGPTGDITDRFYTSFVNRTGVCIDYTRLFYIMAVGAGVPTDRVFGDGHDWNIFWYDKEKRWVLLDATWEIFDITIEELSKLEYHCVVSPYYDSGGQLAPTFYNNSAYFCNEARLYKGDKYKWDGFPLRDRMTGEITTKIEGGLFRNDTSLTSVNIPDRFTDIGNSAFWGCTNLTSITIPNSVKSIGITAFGNCTSLKSIVIPNSVTVIDNAAFEDSTSLESVTISNSVTHIANLIFSGCTSLKSITIPNGVKSIGQLAFRDCTSLTSVKMSDSVTSIEDWVFWKCTSLTDITLPDSVTTIGKCAFRDCTSLTSITIPDSVTSIGGWAFLGCDNLVIYGNAGSYAEKYAKDNNIKFSDGTEIVDYTSSSDITPVVVESNFDVKDSVLTKYNGKDGNVIIPNDIAVTSIGSWAFAYCTSLTSIVIPDSVATIGHQAFRDCTNLTSITIPNSVKSIEEGAFIFCTSLTSVVIPDGLTSIGNHAFASCANLTSITIPDSVTSMGMGVVVNCSKDLVIYGNEGSYAEKYASDNGIKFQKLPSVGDVLGEVMYTDIIAYINGHAIPTHNVNNDTYVVVEDLKKYGFAVDWDNDAKTLKVEWKGTKFTPIKVEKEIVTNGAFKCNYYYTNIKTYISGAEVMSYNINGETLIHFDLLKAYGKVTWDNKARELRLVIE